MRTGHTADFPAASRRARRGRLTSSPLQFGHFPLSALAQVAQNVFSKLQM
jgi:hypothetical protein